MAAMPAHGISWHPMASRSQKYFNENFSTSFLSYFFRDSVMTIHDLFVLCVFAAAAGSGNGGGPYGSIGVLVLTDFVVKLLLSLTLLKGQNFFNGITFLQQGLVLMTESKSKSVTSTNTLCWHNCRKNVDSCCRYDSCNCKVLIL